MEAAVRAINAAIDKGNEQLLLYALEDKSAGLSDIVESHIGWYTPKLKDEKAKKAEVSNF